MITTSETQSKAETTDRQLDSVLPSRKPGRKSILALSVFALGLNATAAVYTLSPSDFVLPNVSILAELLPHQKASDPIPDPVVATLKDIQSAQQQQAAALKDIQSAQQQHAAALKDIQSAQQQQAAALKDIQSAQQQHAAALKDIQSTQQQHAAALQENGSSLQQNTTLLQQDSTTFSSLRQSITDEQVDVKKLSVQLSTLIAKVDSLQITSSIPKGRALTRLSGAAYKRVGRQPKPVGPASVGGAPLTTAPAQGWSPSRSPEGKGFKIVDKS